MSAGGDDVADAEERVVARVGVVEEVLGVGHERRRAQRVADLVDVLALEVLEHGHRADEEVLAPVGRRAGVDAAPRVGAHVGEQLVDLRVLLRVGLGLQADVGRVVGVVGVQVAPGRREHDDQRHDAQPGDDAAPGRFAAPSRGGPREAGATHARRGRAARGTTMPMPASRMPESCTPIWKRRMKMSLLPGQDVVERPEGRPPERHERA